MSEKNAASPVKPYYAGIDIIKILAMFFVVCIHFYLYNGFYYTPIDSEQYFLPIAGRWLVYTCVPMFMTATGYLMKNKTFSKGYYKGLIKIIAVYIIVSIVCIIFNKERWGNEYDAWKIFKGFLEYTNANYAWYVNYYIAIFLLIPFLNLSFNHLETKGQRFILVATVTALSIFAKSMFLGFERDNQSKLFPDYLAGLWPIAYYYAGAFIREYPIRKKLKGKLIVAAVFLADLFFVTFTTYKQSMADYDNDQHVVSWHFNDYGSYPVFILAICIFLLLCDIKTTNKPVKFILRQISGLTLGTYMISYIFDNYYYSGHPGIFGFDDVVGFNEKYADVLTRCSHWYEIVFRNFGLALLCGFVIHKAYDLIELAVRKIYAAASSGKAASAAVETAKKTETAEVPAADEVKESAESEESAEEADNSGKEE